MRAKSRKRKDLTIEKSSTEHLFSFVEDPMQLVYSMAIEYHTYFLITKWMWKMIAWVYVPWV